MNPYLRIPLTVSLMSNLADPYCTVPGGAQGGGCEWWRFARATTSTRACGLHLSARPLFLGFQFPTASRPILRPRAGMDTKILRFFPFWPTLGASPPISPHTLIRPMLPPKEQPSSPTHRPGAFERPTFSLPADTCPHWRPASLIGRPHARGGR